MVFASDFRHVRDRAVRAVLEVFMRTYTGRYVEPIDDFSERQYLAANPDVEAEVRSGGLESGFVTGCLIPNAPIQL